MRIILKNFRCHTDGTFEFPDQGLIALAGSSGSGKSSLLKGLCFGLYGKIPGKVKKPYTHGKTTCSVEIDYLGMHVERHARPKRLLVTYEDKEYEEDTAQNVIHQVLGMNYNEFLATAYVVQRSNASILSLSAADQVKFIETLANSSAERYKAEIKERIKSVEQDIAKIKTEIEVLEAQKEEKEQRYPDTPTVPQEIENGVNPNQIRKKLETLNTALAQHQRNLEESRGKLEKVRAEEKKKSAVEAKIATLKKEIEFLQRTLGDASAESDEDSEAKIAALSAEIAQYHATIEYYRRYISFLKERTSLEHAIAEHRLGVEKKLAELKPDVVNDTAIQIMEEEVAAAEVQKKKYDAALATYDVETARKEQARKALGEKFKAIKAMPGMSDAASIKTPSKMLECLETYLKTKDAELHSLNQQTKEKLVCPCCNATLMLSASNDALEKVEDGSSDDLRDKSEIEDLIMITQASIDIILNYIAEIKRLSESLNVKITAPGDEPPDPVKLHKALLKAKRIKKEYEELDVDTLPRSLEKMRLANENAGKEFGEEVSSEEDAKSYLLELETEVQTKISERGDVARRLEEDLECRKEIAIKQTQLSGLAIPKISGPSSREIEEQVGKLTQKLSDTNREIQLNRKILDSVADYEHYQNTLHEIAGLCEKIVGCQQRLESLERKLEGLYGLEETEKEAEVLALEETVSSINEHAKIYLDQMFAEPIMVRLECVKDKGKGGLKLQLNTTIDYKGNTYDDIEELSGGERQRCDIAFLLAVNDMLGSGILILDECLNELDASINTEVLSLIRDICGGSKMILVISHEAVRGVFDAEIPVGH